MANKDNVLSTLSSTELCDDCLSTASGVKPRQTVYTICTDLFAKGLIYRHHGKCDHCRKAKLTNCVLDGQQAYAETAATAQPPAPQTVDARRPWYWEGNVQAQVVSYLVYNGHTIRNVANTASREAGKDIVAIAPDGSELWVSVKGYPEKSRNVQARHWFSGAVFDLLLYRGQDHDTKLALALPAGFVTYTNLLPRIDWLKETMEFQVFWVLENGSVRVE